MSFPIPQSECKWLLDHIKLVLNEAGVKNADAATLEVANPEYWDLYLLLPSKGLARKAVEPLVRQTLIERCAVEKGRIEFSGKSKARNNAYCWFFTHPNIPPHVQDWADEESRQSSADDFYLPSPQITDARGSETAFLTLKGEFYRAIERGEKTIEYRGLTDYYCDRLFATGKPVKRVRFQLGYSSTDGSAPPQMEFEVDSINLFSEVDKTEFPAMWKGHVTKKEELPGGYIPTAYAIHLGRRIS